MQESLDGNTVVVTGASAGVGRAVVREFARRGANIGLIARGSEGLENARREAEEAGVRAVSVPADVAEADQVDAAADRIERELGPIDIWVNDAMTTVFSRFLDIRPDEFERATRVTYLGFVWGTMAALRRMKQRNRGSIVQVGSALAYRSIPLQSPYCGAKHAIVGFTDSLRSELIHDGIDVHLTIVHLPAMNTPQFDWCRSRLPRHPQPVPPIYQPEVAARAIVWASQQRRREVYVGWPTVKAIYGQMLMPGFADRYLAKHAWEQQETGQPVAPNRPDNLFSALPGDRGAHGIFDDLASGTSVQVWADMHREAITLSAAAAGLAGLGMWVARKARSRIGHHRPDLSGRVR